MASIFDPTDWILKAVLAVSSNPPGSVASIFDPTDWILKGAAIERRQAAHKSFNLRSNRLDTERYAQAHGMEAFVNASIFDPTDWILKVPLLAQERKRRAASIFDPTDWILKARHREGLPAASRASIFDPTDWILKEIDGSSLSHHGSASIFDPTDWILKATGTCPMRLTPNCFNLRSNRLDTESSHMAIKAMAISASIFDPTDWILKDFFDSD